MNTDIRKRNDALKYHREIRGWSQQKVAELVETSEDMVGRWERGISKPSPFYRERLCNLFGVNAEELGFLEKTTNREAPLQKAGSSPTSPQHGAITTSPYFSFGHLETTWIVVDGDERRHHRLANLHASIQCNQSHRLNTRAPRYQTANTDAHFSGTVKDIALIDLSSAAAPQRKISC